MIQVEAYSGYRLNERPLSFILDGHRHEVVEVLDRWYEGGLTPKSQQLDYFKVRTTQGRDYILRYNFLFDAWAVLLPSPAGTSEPGSFPSG